MFNKTDQHKSGDIYYVDSPTSSKNPYGCLDGETKVAVISPNVEVSAKSKEKSDSYLNTVKKVFAVFGAIVSFTIIAGLCSALGFSGNHGLPFKIGCIGFGALLGGIAAGCILEKAFRKHDSIPQQVNDFNSNEPPENFIYSCS
jgi:hypothetical protein